MGQIMHALLKDKCQDMQPSLENRQNHESTVTAAAESYKKIRNNLNIPVNPFTLGISYT